MNSNAIKKILEYAEENSLGVRIVFAGSGNRDVELSPSPSVKMFIGFAGKSRDVAVVNALGDRAPFYPMWHYPVMTFIDCGKVERIETDFGDCELRRIATADGSNTEEAVTASGVSSNKAVSLASDEIKDGSGAMFSEPAPNTRSYEIAAKLPSWITAGSPDDPAGGAATVLKSLWIRNGRK